MESKFRAEKTDKETQINNRNSNNNKRNAMQTHIEYGIITEVDYNTCKLKVERLTSGKELKNGKNNFHWLLTPINEIHMLYGPLVPGMKCRIHWEGVAGSEPGNNVAVDILGNKVDRLDNKDYKANELKVGPGRKIFQ